MNIWGYKLRIAKEKRQKEPKGFKIRVWRNCIKKLRENKNKK